MTENEAIEVLNNFDMQVSAKADGAYQSTIGGMACKIAVKALSEIQQYRAIGTVEECREAMERQRGRKVRNRILLRDFNNRFYSVCGDCPNCRNAGLLSTNTDYCDTCGQKLDWSDTD